MEVMLYAKILAHLRVHPRFYAALVLGLAAIVESRGLSWPFRLLSLTDTFFIAYLASSAVRFGDGALALRARARSEDVGIFLVVLIVVVAVGTGLIAVIIIIHHSKGQITGPLLGALAAAPLGWATLHVVAAFHYANLYYTDADDPSWEPPLQFPGKDEPVMSDFLYYAIVIGMAAQTADVATVTAKLRRASLAHGMVSFLFNTVLVAMSVNAVMSLTG
jgi:uncharacterized membrane protein